ncbi:MAG: hypothetical protein M3441_08680 [Chloroflexota bacterium]|nr:hypothetical protein [Chloroflexota bacterium]
MTSGIYVVRDDGTLVEMSAQLYTSEDDLQTLLAKHPSLLAGDQMNPASPRRWLLIAREAPLPSEQDGYNRWSIDHLFLDQDAIPTIVEVKRSTDTRIRREVVGQMLDYAANSILYWPIERILSMFQSTCESLERNPGDVLSAFLEENTEAEEFWTRVKTNLQAGRIRLVFVADEIPSELRRIIEFLNAQMDPAEVLGVEIKHYSGSGLRTLVPRVLGQTAAKVIVPPSPRATRQWDEASFMALLADANNGLDVTIARKLLEWARSRGLRVSWGKGATLGSFLPIIDHGSASKWTFAVYAQESGASVELQFAHMRTKPPFTDDSRRLELLQKINSVLGTNLPPEAINRRPNVPISVLQNTQVLTSFLQVFDSVVDEIRGMPLT